MKSEAVAVGTRETGNLVKQERLGKAIEKAKKLRKHKHLHLNYIHVLCCIKAMLFFSTSNYSIHTISTWTPSNKLHRFGFLDCLSSINFSLLFACTVPSNVLSRNLLLVLVGPLVLHKANNMSQKCIDIDYIIYNLWYS